MFVKKNKAPKLVDENSVFPKNVTHERGHNMMIVFVN